MDPATRFEYQGSWDSNKNIIGPLPGRLPVGGDAQTEPPYRSSRKKAGEVYTPGELPETDEQTRRVHSRRDEKYGHKDICRTCFLNNIPTDQCSRSAPRPTPKGEACTRCSRRKFGYYKGIPSGSFPQPPVSHWVVGDGRL